MDSPSSRLLAVPSRCSVCSRSKPAHPYQSLRSFANTVTLFRADFPSLNDVKGAFNVSSASDIQESCDKFKSLAPSSQGGNGKIQGKFDCVPLNAKATEETGNGSGSGGGDSGNSKDAASGVTLNTALLALAGIACLVQAFL